MIFARSTWAKSRTRRSRRLATRGGPRLRRAISVPPSPAMGAPPRVGGPRPSCAPPPPGEGDAEQLGRARHDFRQLFWPIEVEPVDDAEAGPQGGADQPRPR